MLLRWYCAAASAWHGLRTRLEEDRGATAVEYAIMLAFIAAVIVAAVAFIGRETNSAFQNFSFDPP